ncbi:hypothetical protein [Arthrospiribacter ruber]|uniref:Uncharacterized protein n=1 Tax=Arthrospiribacter ruber TaxID=2487934 RepID=A0A951IRW2_9BACT|nr:hypothetical protein [Arthrospiribacter ruber]MBW3466543.1 hypothetical protein [Arthrospiribacter ruber]
MTLLKTTTHVFFPITMTMKKSGDDVDKGTKRKDPSKSDGAKPPTKEEYRKIQEEKEDGGEENTGQEVDNEKKDKNQK